MADGERDKPLQMGLRDEGLLSNGKAASDPNRIDLLKALLRGKRSKGLPRGEPIVSAHFPL